MSRESDTAKYTAGRMEDFRPVVIKHPPKRGWFDRIFEWLLAVVLRR